MSKPGKKSPKSTKLKRQDGQWIERSGKRLRALRRSVPARGPVTRGKSAYLGQAEIAEVVGVTQPTLANWEKGVYSPKGVDLRRLADFFGVSVDYLLCRTDNRHGVPKLILDPDAVEKILEAEHWDDLRDQIHYVYLLFGFMAGANARAVSQAEWDDTQRLVIEKVKKLGPPDRSLLEGLEKKCESTD